MSDTPKVDAINATAEEISAGYLDLIVLARKLERENAKLREAVTRAIEQFHAFGWPAVDLENALKN